MSKIKKLFNIISKFIFIIILVFFVFTIYMRADGRSISFFGYTFNVVVTPSMEGDYTTETGEKIPKIFVGDLVFVKKTKIEDVKLYDIVMYNTNLSENVSLGIKRIIHLVVEVNECDEKVCLVTQGTANSQPDNEQITEIIGVYKGKSGILGRIILFYKNPVNIIFTATLLTAFYICYKLFVVIVKEINKD